MKSLIKKYLKLIDDIICDVLGDLKSFRYQLMLLAYVFNGFILYLVYLGKADYKLSGIGIALLTAIYTYVFASKHNESIMNNQKNLKNNYEKSDDSN